MEIAIICILTVIVVGVALGLVYRFNKLKKEIARKKREIELHEYFISTAIVASDQVSVQQLEQIKVELEQAKQKSKHLDDFGKYVQPVLQYVIDNTKKMAEGKFSEEERAKAGKKIRSYSVNLTSIIEDVLLMARIDSDNVVYNMAVHNVEDIVQPVFDQFKNADRESYLMVENKGDLNLTLSKGSQIAIRCDHLHLMKALHEVLENAFQFTCKGSIRVGWFYMIASDEVEIFVEDNGIGIKSENYNRIFEPFFKENPSYSGVGIGLTLAKSLVENMDGRIYVTSRGDFGTRISIVLPCVKETEE